MPAIHQLLHTLSYGDAISSEVLALQRCLRDLNFESEIYCIHTHHKYTGLTKSYLDLSADLSAEIVLHYSLGSPLNETYRKLNKAKRTLIYHNITPAQWYEKINPQVTKDIQNGLHELPELCRLSHRILADSQFNADELAKHGIKAELLLLPLDPEKWLAPHNTGMHALLNNAGGRHFLHVGRLAPNKCIEDIIKIFYFYHRQINKHSRLWLVGIDIDTELYVFGLKRLVFDLELEEAVVFTGCLADEEIKSLYMASDLYLCMSEHEGFCLPLVEAMHFELPIVAYASSAIPETLGEAGILVKEKKHAEIACLIDNLFQDTRLQNKLAMACKRHLTELDFSVFSRRVQQLFTS